MRKAIYLFLTVLIVACSGDGGGDEGGDDGGNNNTSSLVGTWNLTSITDVNGVPQDLEATCANENYFIADDTSGTAYFHFNEDGSGKIIPCYESSTDDFTYINSPAGSLQYILTAVEGGELFGELSESGNILTLTQESSDNTMVYTKE